MQGCLVWCKTLQRRERWTTGDEFTKALSGKSLFKGFSAEVFQDYATHGLRTSNKRVMPHVSSEPLTLNFRKTWEAQVFLTPPYVWRKIKRLQVQCVVWRGETGDVVPIDAWHKWEKIRPEKPRSRVASVGTHSAFASPYFDGRRNSKKSFIYLILNQIKNDLQLKFTAFCQQNG